MCMICVEIAKGAMTTREARRALGEMREKVGAQHATEVETLLDATDQARPPTRP
ncbi:MAG: hypothetical protein NT062_30380 [Proteobacteria bacterium]|nr:hypothetical protein [Pseudomonadota bacterium]